MPRTRRSVPVAPLAVAGLRAAVVVTVVNVTLHLVLRALGAWSLDVTAPAGGAIGVPAVAALSAAPPLLGALLLVGVDRLMPYAEAVFVALAATIYVLFLFPSLDLGAPVPMTVGLLVMHTVAVGVTVPLVVRAYRHAR